MSEEDQTKDSATGNPVGEFAPDMGTEYDSEDDSEGSPPGKGWPTGDRESLNFDDIQGGFRAKSWTRVLLAMEGMRGRDDNEAHAMALRLGVTGLTGRPRNPHNTLEKCGVIKPVLGVTRLSRLGRMLRDLSGESGLRRYLAREALDFLCRFQSDNPINGRKWPEGCKVHPYWMVLRAACALDHRIHWDEVNRELMHTLGDEEIDDIVTRLAAARNEPGYQQFLGSSNDADGPLRARVHPAKPTAPPGKKPEGQLKDQRFTPFLKLAGFGELLLASPGTVGDGWWTVPEDVRDIVDEAVRNVPRHVEIRNREEWIQWLYEGELDSSSAEMSLVRATPPAFPRAAMHVRDLTVTKVKAALAKHAPALRYSDDLLAAMVAAVRSGDGKNFIILRGVSGTGKSQLVSAIASAIFDIGFPKPPGYYQIEVRPDWTDVTHVLGYYDPVRKEYTRPRFMRALEAANAEFLANGNDASPVFVCLDEMNLAPVELYLADCLSAMESGREIDHGLTDDGGATKEIRWPPNLFLFGTINVDETTAEISDKVLDRAQVIDTSDIEIGDALSEWLGDAKHLSEDDKTLVKTIIVDVWNALRKIHRHFGFRTAKAIVRFVDEAVASSDGVMDAAAALDAQLAQKVLVKLRGEGEQWSKPLDSIKKAIAGLSGAKKSLKIIDRMISDHGRLGSFQFWE